MVSQNVRHWKKSAFVCLFYFWSRRLSSTRDAIKTNPFSFVQNFIALLRDVRWLCLPSNRCRVPTDSFLTKTKAKNRKKPELGFVFVFFLDFSIIQFVCIFFPIQISAAAAAGRADKDGWILDMFTGELWKNW